MTPCQLCEIEDIDSKANPADCEMIIEMRRPSGIRDRKAYAVCESCGSLWMDKFDEDEKQTGLINVA